jgi:hypothetical protein
MAAVSLTMSAHSSQAGLGWTLEQSVQVYGQPIDGPRGDGIGKTTYDFEGQGGFGTISAGFINGRIGEIDYHRAAGFDYPLINSLVSSECGSAQWTAHTSEAFSTFWYGKINGEDAYVVRLNIDATWLSIYTAQYFQQ